MRKTLFTAAAIGLLAGAASAEPLSLDQTAMDGITAGSGMLPPSGFHFDKSASIHDYVENLVLSAVKSHVDLKGNVAISEGAATALGTNTFTSLAFDATTIEGALSRSVGVAHSAAGGAYKPPHPHMPGY
ncbi:MAG: hypothetical protein R3C97_09550 [Geminicoccaceae bacterium]